MGCESEQGTAVKFSSKVLSRKLSIKSRGILVCTSFPWAGDEELGVHRKERESTQEADRDKMSI